VIEAECKRHSIEMPEPNNAEEIYQIIDKLCEGRVSRSTLITGYEKCTLLSYTTFAENINET
jgi:hypothetical protein